MEQGKSSFVLGLALDFCVAVCILTVVWGFATSIWDETIGFHYDHLIDLMDTYNVVEFDPDSSTSELHLRIEDPDSVISKEHNISVKIPKELYMELADIYKFAYKIEDIELYLRDYDYYADFDKAKRWSNQWDERLK